MTNYDILISICIGFILIASKWLIDKRHARKVKFRQDLSIKQQIRGAREWNQRRHSPTSRYCKCGNYAPIGRIYGDMCIKCMPEAVRPVKKVRVVPAIAKPKEV